LRCSVPVLLPFVVGAAGVLAAAAGAGAAWLEDDDDDDEERRLSGVNISGKVARPAAAGSVGRYSAPRCPQAATSPAVPTARQTMSAARARVLTRIWRTFNMAKL